MKKILFLVLFAISLTACGQRPDGTIDTLKVNKIIFPDGTFMSTVPVISQPVTWNTLAGKPEFHNVAYSGDYNVLKNKPEIPQQIGLSEAINKLGYLPIPGNNTTEINKIYLPPNRWGIIQDTVLKVYKLWDGKKWSKIVITSN